LCAARRRHPDRLRAGGHPARRVSVRGMVMFGGIPPGRRARRVSRFLAGARPSAAPALSARADSVRGVFMRQGSVTVSRPACQAGRPGPRAAQRLGRSGRSQGGLRRGASAAPHRRLRDPRPDPDRPRADRVLEPDRGRRVLAAPGRRPAAAGDRDRRARLRAW